MSRLSAFALLLFVSAPRETIAQSTSATGTAEQQAHRIVLQAAAGPQLNGGGRVVSVSIGFSVTERVDLLLDADRISMPTSVRSYSDGYSATRGGTLEFLGGEVRVDLGQQSRVRPFALAGLGRGVSRPNVNEMFPDKVSNDAGVVFCGGGVRLPFGAHLSAFADARYVLFTESDVISLFLPVRAGIAWRF